MKTNMSRRVRGIVWLCALVYFASYLLRNNFAVMLVKVCADLSLAKSTLAVVVTAQTILYGTGQVINGVLGDRISPRTMLAGGLSLAVLCNVAMFFAQSVWVMTLIWAINGFAHAMLWPPILRLFASHLSEDEFSYGVLRVNWASSFATIAMYLFCPLLLKAVSWRVVMLLFALMGAIIVTLWIPLSPRFLGASKRAQEDREIAPVQPHKPLPRYVWLPAALIMVGILAMGMLRDGVTNWTPSFLLESFGMGEENAIFTTVVLAIFSVIAFYFFNLLQRKLLKNEVFCAAVIFFASAIAAIGLYFVNRFLSSAVPATLLMALIVAGTHGINLMLISLVPKRFANSGKVSTFSGIFNAFTYIGAAISTYGFAAIAEGFGWSVTIIIWAVIALIGVAVTLIATPLWRRFRREYAEIKE